MTSVAGSISRWCAVYVYCCMLIANPAMSAWMENGWPRKAKPFHNVHNSKIKRKTLRRICIRNKWWNTRQRYDRNRKMLVIHEMQTAPTENKVAKRKLWIAWLPHKRCALHGNWISCEWRRRQRRFHCSEVKAISALWSSFAFKII